MADTLTDEQMRGLMPLAAHLGMELVEAAPEQVVARLRHAPELCTAGGMLHGGTIMALADSTGAVAAFLNLPDGASTSTTSSSTVFLRGVSDGTVTATARPLHVGRRTIAVVVLVADDQGRPVAQVTQSQAVLS
ncbi:PaaI family thioesterase [Tomitella fengzijianii]|uniref:PaaI family thioesterase n=1 Tax=Tomitella fengzijianii TaxID=2597660 RepID=UPI00131BE4FD|nr:PaaI family thioesterase [Tomitella fengzijianii]